MSTGATSRDPSTALPPLPDFFLVGAPRCGTTALSKYLAQHPAVCFSKPKEPHFFTFSDEASLRDARWREAYARFFWHHSPEHRVVGEGSVSTLYSEVAVDRIARLVPSARYLVMVRNPIDMLRSFHRRMLFLLEENVSDLAAAWRLQEVRAAGRRVPRLCIEPRLLQYGEVARLGHQVGRLFERVGRESCHVVVYDDLESDPATVYTGVLDFLGIEDDGYRDFERHLPSQHYRWRWLQRAFLKPPGARLDLSANRISRARYKATKKRKGKNWHEKLRRNARHFLRDWNRVEQRPAPLDPAFRDELRAHFAPDVEHLGKLLERDLSHWV